MTCRLPQTPKTPSSGLYHYFDDTFTRNAGARPRSRRSSTGRSIGARSDFDDTPVGLGIRVGDGEGDESARDPPVGENGKAGGDGAEEVEVEANGNGGDVREGVNGGGEGDSSRSVRDQLERYSFAE